MCQDLTSQMNYYIKLQCLYQLNQNQTQMMYAFGQKNVSDEELEDKMDTSAPHTALLQLPKCRSTTRAPM